MTNEEKLTNALYDFKTKYPSVTSGDLQTFIIGWQEAVKRCFTPDVVNSNLNIPQSFINKYMKITKPEEMTSGTSKVEEAVSKFEELLAKEEKDQQRYHLVIDGEYNRETCDRIERNYEEAGWTKVKCRTSSENREGSGLTGLQLCRPWY